MKKILITGATSGIGAGLAKAYSNEHLVYACGRNHDALAELKLHKNIEPLCFDVTSLTSIKSETSDIDELDLLILNAGNCEYIDDAINFDSALFERVIRVNLLSIGYCLEALLKKVKKSGHLVIVSSSAAFLPLPRAEAYGTSKAAVTYLAKTLAVDLEDIHVSVVHPGFVNTPLTAKNDFPMPMAVTVDQAVRYIQSGITKKKLDIHFPKRFTMIMKLLQLLPQSMWQHISQGLKK